MDNQNLTSPQSPQPMPTNDSLVPPLSAPENTAPAVPNLSPIATPNPTPVIPSSDNSKNRPLIAKKIQEAYNILVTVSNNPSVDQLSALIGMTLILGRLKKHSSAVYSGETPSIIEFLEPEKTIEKTTDSLQDFIIAIDKAKADKLRYKVEDNMVRIFITPYKTSISENDLNFSLGDLNVDLIIALGVNKQDEIDQAITAHGKILHDAAIIALSNSPERQTVGSLNWSDTTASSLSEMVTLIANDIGAKDLIDSQIATALLAGIVSSTKRFANDKTSPTSLSVSAQLLSSGANQQLVADKMEPPAAIPKEAETVVHNELPPVVHPQVAQSSQPSMPSPVSSSQPSLIKSSAHQKHEESKANIGELDIDHTQEEIEAENQGEPIEKIRIDQSGMLHKVEEGEAAEVSTPAHPSAAVNAQTTISPSVSSPQPAINVAPNPVIQSQTPVVKNPLVESHSSAGYINHPPSSMMDSMPGPESSDFSEQSSSGQASRDHFMFSGPGGMSGVTATNPVAPQVNSNLEAARQTINSVAEPSHQVPAAFNALPLGEDLHPENNPLNSAPTMPLPTNLVPPIPEPTSAPTSIPNNPSSPPPVPPPIINPLPPAA